MLSSTSPQPFSPNHFNPSHLTIVLRSIVSVPMQCFCFHTEPPFQPCDTRRCFMQVLSQTAHAAMTPARFVHLNRCRHLWKCRAQQMALSLVPSMRPANIVSGMSFRQFFNWKGDLRRCNIFAVLVYASQPQQGQRVKKLT